MFVEVWRVEHLGLVMADADAWDDRNPDNPLQFAGDVLSEFDLHEMGLSADDLVVLTGGEATESATIEDYAHVRALRQVAAEMGVGRNAVRCPACRDRVKPTPKRKRTPRCLK